MQAVAGDKCHPGLREQQVVKLFGGEGAGAGDDGTAPPGGFLPQQGEQLRRHRPVGIFDAVDPAAKCRDRFMEHNLPPVRYCGKQPQLLPPRGPRTGQFTVGQTPGVLRELFPQQRFRRQPPGFPQQGARPRKEPHRLPVQPADLLSQCDDFLPPGPQDVFIPAAAQRKGLLHRTGELRLQRMGRGGVQQYGFRFRQDDPIQAGGIGGAENFLHRLPAALRQPCHPFHHGGLAGAGAALDEDAAPTGGGEGELLEQ